MDMKMAYLGDCCLHGHKCLPPPPVHAMNCHIRPIPTCIGPIFSNRYINIFYKKNDNHHVMLWCPECHKYSQVSLYMIFFLQSAVR
jgi:hypothetical protein